MKARQLIFLFHLFVSLLAGACSKSGNAPLLNLPPSEIAAMRFFFTRPQPNASIAERHAARNELLRLTEQARNSIRVWCYGFNDGEVVAALVRAQARGVRVEIIGSPERDYSEIRAAGLNVTTRASSGLQHVKLFIFDDDLLFSGTGNFTRSGFFYNHNAFWTARLNREDARNTIAALKAAPTNHAPESGAGLDAVHGVEILMAPRAGRLIQTRIIQAILSARVSISYMSFSHTDPLINAALFLAARRGVFVRGIYDRGAFSAKSKARELNDSAGLLPLTLYRDGNRLEYEDADGVVHGGHLHHKTLIIDGTRVLTGSYNWSLSARDRNLEMLFDMAAAGPIFLEEFERIRARAELVPRAAAVGVHSARFNLTHGHEPELCSADAPGAGLIRFAGNGAYFRGEFSPPATDASGEPCRPGGKLASASAGPRGLLLPTAAPETFQAVRGPGGVYIALKTEREHLPCEDPARCSPLVITRAWKKDGLLLIPGGHDLRRIRFLSAQGLSVPLDPASVGSDLYRFDPDELPRGDLALFARDGRGREYRACLRSGRAFTGVARDVLQAINGIRGETLPCAELE